jgi:hypothetical protein
MVKMFAIAHQQPNGIFGVGATPEEAWAEWEMGVGNGKHFYDEPQLRRCTESVVELYRRVGGVELELVEVDGVLRTSVDDVKLAEAWEHTKELLTFGRYKANIEGLY